MIANQVPSRSRSIALPVAVRAASILLEGNVIEPEQSTMITSTEPPRATVAQPLPSPSWAETDRIASTAEEPRGKKTFRCAAALNVVKVSLLQFPSQSQNPGVSSFTQRRPQQ